MRIVKKIALIIARKFQKKGIKLDIKLIESGALLHDLLKVISFRSFKPETWKPKPKKEDMFFWGKMREKYRGIHDIDVTVKILKQFHENKLAMLIAKQRFDAIISKKFPLKTWEEKIVYYADKRVLHDKIVPLSQRLKDGRKRYFTGEKIPKMVYGIERKIQELEKELCAVLLSPPKNLTVD